MADDDKQDGRRSQGGSVSPSITRTSSVFPASQSTRPVSGGNAGAYPVRDPRTNQVIGYQDRAGNRVDQYGRPLGADGRPTAAAMAGNAAPREANLGPELTGQALEDYRANTRRERAQRSQADYRAQVQASQEYNRTVVEGQQTRAGDPALAQYSYDPGTGTYTDPDGNTVSGASYRARVARQQAAASATFSSLNVSDLDPSAQFVLSYGERLDAASGNERTSSNQDLRVGGRNASQTTLAERGGPVQNVVSLQTGARWFMQLAQRDKGAYNALVVQLRNAGYLNPNLEDRELPLNGYTRDAGAAFARAAADLADNFSVGETQALLPWLTQRGQGYVDMMAEQEAEAAQEAAYKPVDRSYTDPAAVQAAAKEAAIAALGRKLTDEEEARFTASFRGRENAYYDAIDAAGRAKTAASVADPNLGGQADAFVNGDEYDTERATQKVGEYAAAFQRMMGV